MHTIGYSFFNMILRTMDPGRITCTFKYDLILSLTRAIDQIDRFEKESYYALEFESPSRSISMDNMLRTTKCSFFAFSAIGVTRYWTYNTRVSLHSSF